MGTTVHERAADAHLVECLKDPKGADLLSLWIRRHAEDPKRVEGEWGTYGQTHPRAGRWSPAQLCVAVTMYGFINSGRYAQHPMPTLGTPHADREREANAAGLADLKQPFRAEVSMHQNGADCDGSLYWDETINVAKSTGEPFIDPIHGGQEPVVIKRKHGPGWAPLEIGYTKPSRTMLHMLQFGAVARWPYGYDYLTLIVDLERFTVPAAHDGRA